MKLTMAQALLKFLAQQFIVIDEQEFPFVYGMFAIFGHGNVTGLGEALEYDNYGITCFQGHNEQGMAHAAIAFAKQKNRLGIIPCTSSIGPGATNMVTAAATATANRLPLLLLPGDIFSSRQPDPVLQQIEQAHDYSMTVNDCFKPVSKYWDRINRPEQLMQACLNAFRILTSPKDTGAVTLCLPQDVQTESYDYPASFFKKRLWYIDRVQAPVRQLHQAASLIKEAHKPLIIAGGGIHYSTACSELREFAYRHGIPVAETQAGKSALNYEEQCNVGGVGVTGSQAANLLAKEADLIIAIGTRLQDFTTASKTAFSQARLLHLNVNEMDGLKMDGVHVQGDAKTNLRLLTQLLEGYQTSFAYQQQVTALRAQWDDEVTRLTSQQSHRLQQTTLVGVLNDFMGEDDTIICAAGSLPGDLHRLWKSKAAKDYHVEYAYSCMGYEVAAGLGVAMAKSKGQSYVIVGDGSYLMMHSEVVTAIQEGIKFTIILLDNSGFQCINQLQRANGSQGFGTEFRKRTQGKLIGDKLAIDFKSYAQALGVHAVHAKTLDEFKQQLAECQQVERPCLIELKVDPTSMSQGYECWWRVGVAQTSKSNLVKQAHDDMIKKVAKAREY